MTKISLFLLGQKGYCSLKAILETTEFNLSKIYIVIIGTDAGVLNDFSDDIQGLCKSHNLPYQLGNKYRDDVLDADFGIAIGWRMLIKTTSMKLIVFHDSLLPKYRGFNPLVTALIEGDSEIGVTAIWGEESFDTGSILGQKAINIDYPIKIQEAINMVAELYGLLIVDVLKLIENGTTMGVKQNSEFASYSLWRNDEDYLINWNDDSQRIKRFIDSVGPPYLGACTKYGESLIKIIEAESVQDLNIINRCPGKLLFINDNKPIVVCGKGLLQIIQAKDVSSGEDVVFKKLSVKLK
jgi:methionyl-tRNA formyltransferase